VAGATSVVPRESCATAEPHFFELAAARLAQVLGWGGWGGAGAGEGEGAATGVAATGGGVGAAEAGAGDGVIGFSTGGVGAVAGVAARWIPFGCG
jgi:hypothetical protein